MRKVKNLTRALSLMSVLLIAAPVLGGSTGEEQLQAISDQLEGLEKCDETQNCPQDPTNPRNSYYLLGEQINAELGNLEEWQRQFGESKESRAIVLHYLGYPNEFVQLKAVTILGEMSTDDATADLLLNRLPRVRDKEVLIPWIAQLQRYPHLQQQIDNTFANILQRGSFEAARVLAENIGPFLTADNLSFYQQIHAQLPVNSAKALALGKAIDHQIARNQS